MVNDGCYAECLVSRKNTVGGYIYKCLMIALMIITGLGFIVLLINGIFAISLICFCLFGIASFLSFFSFSRFSVDWEYVFVDGQLDFDQILGGNARRRKKRIDFEKLEVLAPTKSHHLDNYKHLECRTLDYSSLFGNETYTIICHDGNELLKIYFEPDEAMVSTMKSKSPRKVFMD